MEVLFREFNEAHSKLIGPLLAATITPVAPPNNINRLRNFYHGSSQFSVAADIRTGLLAHTHTDLRFLKSEGTTWVDLYVAYWKAVGEILDAESMRNEANWPKVYEAWKEVANVLIRGYSSAGFQAWTVPCLYVVGQYLRIFAIRADASMKSFPQDGVFGADSFQDDIVGEYSKNERLEDAARIINRIFTLCISDRYARMENPCF